MEFQQFPVGLYFHRTPQDCIHYLTCKVTSAPLPLYGVIFDLDPYNLKQLPDIFSTVARRGELYLFTKLRRKGRSGTVNADRKVGKGTWHGDQTRDVEDDHDGTKVGMFQKLRYRENGSHNNQKFLMTEYTLLKGTSLNYDPLKDFVLCHIVKSSRRRHNGGRVCNSQSEPEAALLDQSEPGVADSDLASSSVETQPFNPSPPPQEELDEFLLSLESFLNDEEMMGPLNDSWESFLMDEETMGL